MKRCLVITPPWKYNDNTRQVENRLWEMVLKPALLPMKYEIKRSDLTNKTGGLSEIIYDEISHADLVIADLTDGEPIMFYELGKYNSGGGHCILLTRDSKTVPFNLEKYRIIEYNLNDIEQLKKARYLLRKYVEELKGVKIQPKTDLLPQENVKPSNATLVVERQQGRREHYYLAEKLANIECSSMFLMQRSSSIILGPEDGWDAESAFYEALIGQLDKGTTLYHIVNIEGIKRHLERQHSIFLNTSKALSRLSCISVYGKNLVTIDGPKSQRFLKKIPEIKSDPDLKPDRQARTFIIKKTDGEAEGVLVLDLGGMQSSFHIRGPIMTEFFDACKRYYDECDLLEWEDLKALLPKMGISECIGESEHEHEPKG